MISKLTLKTKIIIAVCAFFALLLAVGAVGLCLATPSITLDGKDATIEVFSDISVPEADATASVLFFKIPLDFEKSGEVDTQVIGTYDVTYKAEFMGKKVKKTIKYNVVDTVAPQIVCDDCNITVEGYYPTDPETLKITCSASDNYDGDLSQNIVKTIDGNRLVLTIKDSSGNTSSTDVNIIVNDGIYPTLVLSGPQVVYLPAGTAYSELGYSATDNLSGNITSRVIVSGNIDNNQSGTYKLKYSVTDDANNTTTVVRRVVVYGTKSAEDYKDVVSNGKTVYLTFDDGPGVYTERLLGTLDNYGVKATFFVTNQFRGYTHLIKTAYDKGHAIGAHTSSHKWSIYNSKENYYADFNAINDTIFAQTGQYTRIFRFPGGTNNTISKSTSKGIMTLLSQEMLASGFVYFDWNVDCNDSRYSKSQDVISSTISQISTKTNAVVLMHDIKKQTVDAVPAIIEYCLQNGYTFRVLTPDSPSCAFKPVN